MNPGIATLSMYDWPETRSALDVFWEHIKNQLEIAGIQAPECLLHVEDQMPLWRSPDLVIGQTCGWPYANRLRGDVVPFARFDYGLEGCPAGMYQSVYIGRSPEDTRYIENAIGLSSVRSVAVNSEDSQSGFHVFSEISGQPAGLAIAPDKRVLSGAHRNSVLMVADGSAQVAAIDAIAFELAKRHDPETTRKVHVIGKSEPRPGLPLVTARTNTQKTNELFAAVKRALGDLDPEARDILMIKAILKACDEDYSVFAADL